MLIPLENIENARGLLVVGRDILNGMYLSIWFDAKWYTHLLLIAIASAFHKGNVYHRDISAGNVMMTEDRDIVGILNDWDQAQQTDSKQSQRVVRISSFLVSLLYNTVL